MNRRSTLRALVLILATSAVPLAFGCDDGGSGTPRYAVFDPSNLDGQLEEATRAAELVVASKAATAADADTAFAAILMQYRADLPGRAYSLEDAVTGVVDEHAYGSATVGAYLDAQMEAAIALGAAATTSNPNAARDLSHAQQAVDKLPLVYHYLATYSGLTARTRSGLDHAYGIYSFVPDALGNHYGLYASAAKREAAWTIDINDALEGRLVDARARLTVLTTTNVDVAGTDLELDHAIEHADLQMLRVFAYGTRTYLEKLLVTPSSAPDKAMIEGRIFWVALRPWAEANQPAAAAAVTAALYPTGEAAIDHPSLHTAYGLGAYYNATYDGMAAPGLAGIETIIAVLEAD